MQFSLQLGHPKIQRVRPSTVEQLKDAFLSLFRAEEESGYLFWQEVPIQLRYREELANNFDQILAMVWLIQRDQQGATKINLNTQLLSAKWSVKWQDDELTIQSTFAAHDGLYSPYADALNLRSHLHLSRQMFLCEWKTLLHQIIVAFKAANIEIQDGTERRKWELLQRVEQQIPQYGQLYLQHP